MFRDLSVLAVTLLLLFAQSIEAATFDVTKYGGGNDIAQGFMGAWKAACAAPSASVVLIPQGTFFMNPVDVHGPCKAPIEIRLQGTVQAPEDPAKMKINGQEAKGWITITLVDRLTITGGGVLDGKGELTWKQNNCHIKKFCKMFPINLRFFQVTNSYVTDITTKDSKGFHVNVINAQNLTFEHFTVSAPERSLNTDGIHLGRSKDIKILNSEIKTGDDCISVGDDMQQLHVESVTCGPGHGFSIGSLGMNNGEKNVIGVSFKHCSLTNTMFGVRIKSWPDTPNGYSCLVDGVSFEDITVTNVSQPVLIDQEYCPHNHCNKAKNSMLQISNVKIKNVRGTSASDESVTILCSGAKPCKNIEVSDIDLKSHKSGVKLISKCDNVKPTLGGKLNPPICTAKPIQSA